VPFGPQALRRCDRAGHRIAPAENTAASVCPLAVAQGCRDDKATPARLQQNPEAKRSRQALSKRDRLADRQASPYSAGSPCRSDFGKPNVAYLSEVLWQEAA
jgi:hypothetical protein